MKLENKGVPGLSQTAASALSGEDTWQSVRRRPTGLTIRVREIDCMVADIQAQIQTLRREQTYLGLVREELAGEAANWSRSSRGKTSPK